MILKYRNEVLTIKSKLCTGRFYKVLQTLAR